MTYSKMTKDQLLAEVEKRNSIGREIVIEDGATNADIVAALELDDADAEEHARGNLPEGKREGTEEVNPFPMPANSDYKGEYVNKVDGETYGLCVVQNDPLEKPYKLKNTAHFWEGSEAQFKETFDRK